MTIKGIESYPVETPQGLMKPRAAVFRPGELDLDDFTITGCPLTFQQFFPGIDIRVCVFGETVYAFELYNIDPNADPRIVDWRMIPNKDSLKVVVHQLPAEIAQRFIAWVKAMGVNHAMIDARLSGGEYTPLDFNPGGLWGFCEDKSGLPLGLTVANLLLGRPAPV